MPHDARQAVLFPDLLSKPVHVAFDEPRTTSDGGAILLRSVDERLGLTEALATSVRDPRQASKIEHEVVDLIRQRSYALALGYVDVNDVARTSHDPMHKLLLDRDPINGAALASQPTLSRFENQQSRTNVMRMARAVADTVVAHHKRRLQRKKVRRVTIDLDLTDDLTHGSQQLSLFNTHYGGYCYLPLLGFLTFNNEPDQYLFAAMLRPGTAKVASETIALLSRIIDCLRTEFPRTKIRVRLDGGFAGPKLLDFLDEQKVEYLVAIGKNSVLERKASRLLATVRRRAEKTGRSHAQFGATRYAARTWRKKRRVIYKAEVVCLAGRKPRDNARFVVTNLKLKPRSIYRIYRMRGESENRIKELLHDLEIDRTSCHRFMANQFRVLMTAAAYVLFQTLRARLQRLNLPQLARAQVGSLRLMLLKIGGRVESSVRRFTIHFAENHPWRDQWRRIATLWGATRL